MFSIFAVILSCPAISPPNLRPPISRPGPTFHGDVPFVLLQLFEELQGLLTQKAEDREPSQAPDLHRRAGSKAQGEGLPGAVCGGHVAQPSGSGVAWLFCLLHGLNERSGVEPASTRMTPLHLSLPNSRIGGGWAGSRSLLSIRRIV